MKKRLFFVALSLCLVLSLCLFAGCKNKPDSSTESANSSNSSDQSGASGSSTGGEQNASTKYSEGLEFTLNGDGLSYSVTGIGTCTDKDVIIPSTYNSKPVTVIGYSAFEGCKNLTSVIIPDGVIFIGECAFGACLDLISITIPKSVTSIGDEAFYFCSKLVEVIDKSNLNITKGSWDDGEIGHYA